MMAYSPLSSLSFPPVPHAAAPLKIVNASVTDSDGFVTEVAVSVAMLAGVAGTLAGGAYVTLCGRLTVRVPQAGEHCAPFAVSVQVTPAPVGSFCTSATNWVLKKLPVPAASSLTLF